ncbi:MAG: peptidylprolyl isomerase [Parcubacteria group bacterium]|jgi:cyclophilin family peptidyl-prolyl cis-trans isomerase
MQKTKFVLLAGAAMLLSGCSLYSQPEPTKKDVPEVKQDAGYLQGMLDKNKQAQQDIQNATDAENKKLNNALDESGLKDKPTTMDYTKQYSQAILKTNLGNIAVKFSADKPLTVNNFLKLSAEKFYDGTKFHRVIPGFMIQGGDPNSKDDDWSNDGTGGPGYAFKDELTGTEKYPQGTLAMANSGPNTNGSQFFIVTASPAAQLPPSYTVFGQVVSGVDVALKIEKVERNGNDHPLKDVTIQGIELVK